LEQQKRKEKKRKEKKLQKSPFCCQKKLEKTLPGRKTQTDRHEGFDKKEDQCMP